jgi:dynactin complex subunit
MCVFGVGNLDLDILIRLNKRSQHQDFAYLPQIGDRVIVGGSKLGRLHFCGTTDFAAGIWAGVELDAAEGKHDGTVEGVSYFVCPPDRGVFVQPNKISKVGHKHFRKI